MRFYIIFTLLFFCSVRPALAMSNCEIEVYDLVGKMTSKISLTVASMTRSLSIIERRFTPGDFVLSFNLEYYYIYKNIYFSYFVEKDQFESKVPMLPKNSFSIRKGEIKTLSIKQFKFNFYCIQGRIAQNKSSVEHFQGAVSLENILEEADAVHLNNRLISDEDIGLADNFSVSPFVFPPGRIDISSVIDDFNSNIPSSPLLFLDERRSAPIRTLNNPYCDGYSSLSSPLDAFDSGETTVFARSDGSETLLFTDESSFSDGVFSSTESFSDRIRKRARECGPQLFSEGALDFPERERKSTRRD